MPVNWPLRLPGGVGEDERPYSSLASGCIGGASELGVACYPPSGRCWVAEVLSLAGVDRVCGILGKGHAGIVVLALWRSVLTAVKVRRRDSRRRSLAREGALAMRASRFGAAPRIYAYGDDYIIMDPVLGPALESVIERGVEVGLVERALDAARALDTAWILHSELHRPWRNILFTEGAAVILDYDSAGDGCGNVVRLVSGLARRIHRLGAIVKGGEFRLMAREYYRSGCDRGAYEDIKHLVLKTLGL